MATIEEVATAIRNADMVGDSASVRALAPVYKAMKHELAVEQTRAQMAQEYDPTKGMSALELGAAGFHKAFRDLGRGARQILNIDSQQDVDEQKALDAPLERTTAGRVGNVVGTVAAAIPTMFVPGAATVLGAGAVGAGMGALEPTATGESRLRNIGLGAAGGAGGVLAGRAVAAGVQGARALVEPLTQGGRDRIAGRTLTSFGIKPADVVGVSNAPTITGARTTLAEQIADPAASAGAARLQDAIRTASPEAAGKFTTREVENNAARVGTLQDLAGQDGGRDFAVAMRQGTAEQMYEKAFGVKMDASALSTGEKGELTKLLKKPAIQDAMATAKEMAQNAGIPVNDANGSIQGLHLMKLALDDKISALRGGTAKQVNQAMSMEVAQKRLVSFIDRMSGGAYGDARQTYAAMSKPVNQMDVAGELLKKGTAATSDLAGTPRLMPDALLRAAGNEEQLIANATGRKGLAKKLSDLLTPEQLAKVQGVTGEADKLAAVGRAANGPGSATAQRLATRNILRQAFGPLGLPETWAESTLLNTAMRPVQFLYNGVAEPKIQQTVTEMMLNPEKAREVLRIAQTMPQSLPPNVQRALPYLAQAMRTSLPASLVSGQR